MAEADYTQDVAMAVVLDASEAVFKTHPDKDIFCKDFLRRISSVSQGSEFNPVRIVCSNGSRDIPAVLVAATSPVFRATFAGTGWSTVCDELAVVMPDLSVDDLDVFIKNLCAYRVAENSNLPFSDTEEGSKSETEAIARVMDLLCAEFKGAEDDPVDSMLLFQDWASLAPDVGTASAPFPRSSASLLKSSALTALSTTDNKENEVVGANKSGENKRRVGRPRKSAVKAEPYIKTEILETPRQETSYSLRQKIKRKRFADEVSDPSDLEDEEDEDDSNEESDMDFKAEGEDDDEEEEEEEDGEEEEVEVDSEETNTDDGEGDELEEHSFAIQLPAEGAAELTSEDLNPQAYYLVKVDSDGSVELISREHGDLEDGVPFGLMCNACDFVSVHEHELGQHMESCPGSKASSSLLKSASVRSAKATLLQCDACNFTSDSARVLLKHRKEAHSREGRKRVGRRGAAGASGRQKVCRTCAKRFKTVAGMKKHARRCGRSDPGAAKSKVKCAECSAEFKREEDMQAHALIHYGQVTCPIHQILFKQESEVYQHVNVAPADAKFPCLQCCMCDKQFRHMCIFMKHIRRHLRISPYRCGICHKHLNTYASLQLHQQRMHGGRSSAADLAVEPEVEAEAEPVVLPVDNRLFTCKECHKTFGTKGHLKEHILGVHEKSEVSNCPVCAKIFNTKKRMKKHLFSSHKDVSEQFRRNTKLETFSDEGVAVQIVLKDID